MILSVCMQNGIKCIVFCLEKEEEKGMAAYRRGTIKEPETGAVSSTLCCRQSHGKKSVGTVLFLFCFIVIFLL